jgi:hypothetical protein
LLALKYVQGLPNTSLLQAILGCALSFQQVEDGAMVVDINLDDGLLDGLQAMQKFCKIAVTEPDVSRVRIICNHLYLHLLHAYTLSCNVDLLQLAQYLILLICFSS